MESSAVRRLIGVIALVVSGLLNPVLLQAQSVAVADQPESNPKSTMVSLSIDGIPLQQALKMIAQQAGLTPFYSAIVTNSNVIVTMRVKNVPVIQAFEKALDGTGVHASIVGGKVLFEPNSTGQATVMQGGIAGKVVDAKTKRGLRGATVTLSGTKNGATTNDDGGFRLSGIPPGIYTMEVRLLGYVKASRSVSIADGQTASMEMTLEPSVNALDQVIVTGTVIASELKSVPNAITVITAKQIAERGITRIDQLFRGDIPGLFVQNQGSNAALDEVTMFSRGVTSLNANDPQTYVFTAFSNPIKTYLDGVEVADPKYLSQIDPTSIERVEILTGPQASTIYGSNAINGVMQIFTKRGTSARPQLTMNLMSGWVENNFSSAVTPQHDHSAQLSGVEGRLSYNSGASWNYIGPWTPAKQTSRTNVFGGVRMDLGHVTADVTGRRSLTKNRQRGVSGQLATGYREVGWYSLISGSGRSVPTTSSVEGQTLGFVLGYLPLSWWSHELGFGQDVSSSETQYTTRGYLNRSDTTLLFYQSRIDRRSLHYTTTTQIPIAAFVRGIVTVGTDAWRSLGTSILVQPQSLTGVLTGTASVSRQPEHNTGGFIQTQIGLSDRLFFTYGLRAEWNPNYGEDAQPNYAPRYGIAYTYDWGSITTKLRGSYGRSTRPPQSGLKFAKTAVENGANAATVQDYGNYDYRLANTALGPEHQQGAEGGVELYWGSRGALIVTRYNQTVNGLIAQPIVDSVRSLVPNPPSGSGLSFDDSGYGYVPQYQYVNVGNIRNQGWELQGRLVTGPFSTRGTYSWTKSRTIGVDPRYRSFFTAISYPQYQPGATFQYLPEHTWSVGLTYASRDNTISLNLTGIGEVMNSQDAFSSRNLFGTIRLPQNKMRWDGGATYVNVNEGYVMADIIALRRISRSIEGTLQVQNLTDRYTNDYAAVYAAIGRQAKAGLRIRL